MFSQRVVHGFNVEVMRQQASPLPYQLHFFHLQQLGEITSALTLLGHEPKSRHGAPMGDEPEDVQARAAALHAQPWRAGDVAGGGAGAWIQ